MPFNSYSSLKRNTGTFFHHGTGKQSFLYSGPVRLGLPSAVRCGY